MSETKTWRDTYWYDKRYSAAIKDLEGTEGFAQKALEQEIRELKRTLELRDQMHNNLRHTYNAEHKYYTNAWWYKLGTKIDALFDFTAS